ncbi:MAG: SCO6880 family protein, partial [Acidimicrobiales bacterium]
MSDRRYRLAPQDRTGWMFGLAGPQILTLGAGIVISILVLQAGVPLRIAAGPVLLGLILALVRVGGRSLLEWVPSVWRWVRSHGSKDKVWLAPLTRGASPPPTTPALPPPLAGQVILVTGDDGPPVGVVWDRKGDTYAATIRVAGRQFALVERGEQENLLAMWGDALAPFCQERGPVVEVR